MSNLLKMTLAFTVGLGLFMFVFMSVARDVEYGLEVGLLTAGLTFVVSLIVIPIMTKGFGLKMGRSSPRVSATVTVALSPYAAFDRAAAAVTAAGASITESSKEEGTLRARMPGDRRSMGENIEVTVRPGDAEHCDVSIRSSPRMRTTLVDWGKGQENVDRISAGLTEGEGGAGAAFHPAP